MTDNKCKQECNYLPFLQVNVLTRRLYFRSQVTILASMLLKVNNVESNNRDSSVSSKHMDNSGHFETRPSRPSEGEQHSQCDNCALKNCYKQHVNIHLYSANFYIKDCNQILKRQEYRRDHCGSRNTPDSLLV